MMTKLAVQNNKGRNPYHQQYEFLGLIDMILFFHFITLQKNRQAKNLFSLLSRFTHLTYILKSLGSRSTANISLSHTKTPSQKLKSKCLKKPTNILAALKNGTFYESTSISEMVRTYVEIFSPGSFQGGESESFYVQPIIDLIFQFPLILKRIVPKALYPALLFPFPPFQSPPHF